jgi:hypothetical protein
MHLELVIIDYAASLGVASHLGDPGMGHPRWSPKFYFLGVGYHYGEIVK